MFAQPSPPPVLRLPRGPSGRFALHSEESWDEMYDAFIAYAQEHQLDTAHHERPRIFKDAQTKAIWTEWKRQWTLLIFEKLEKKE